MKKYIHSVLALSIVSVFTYTSAHAAALTQLSDKELSEQTGQALLSLAYTNPTGAGTGATYTDYGYYKLGLEAKMELNANIKNLQLGCGGRNGPGACDIEMSNVSLSGPADTVVDNTPTWSKGRANTSAVITNPFIEFAIKNPTSASQREVVGFRLSAEDILGYLSAGTSNTADPTDGIKSFSGYLKVAQTPVNAYTNSAMFGTVRDQSIFAKITALGNNRTVTTNPNGMTPGASGYTTPDSSTYINPVTGQREWGINVSSQQVKFNFPQTAVTGNRMSQLNLVVRDVAIPTIAIGADSGGLLMRMDDGILGLANNPIFYMGAKGTTAAGCASDLSNTSNCSYITNLKANVTVKQNFNLIHNLPLTSGGYLSLQKEALRWPGSASAFVYDLSNGSVTNVADNYNPTSTQIFNAGDIAQPGWWMSFKDPLDFGALNPTSGIPMQDVLPQIATFITNYLSQNNISLSAGEALNAGLFGAPIYKGIGNIQLADDARAVMVLQNLLLDNNQKPTSNCFGNLKFC
ncbi:hypothetical protein [Acinetobacter guerrae]|uniref:hypothetical protein n=1 Tax=Acinetobacter guerrae TaxID=1843371 RepID=UPI00125FD0EA|nr:hypothetical protein [Acinetobacter guerrae]